MKSLDLLLWLTLGPLVVAAAVVVAGFVVELVRVGANPGPTLPNPAQPWHPRTEADTAPLADAPETEAAIRQLHAFMDAHGIERRA